MKFFNNTLHWIVVVLGLSIHQSTIAAEPQYDGDDIVVTVARRAQSVQSLPISVASINGAQLQSIASVHPAETLNRVAGVNVHRNSGQEHLTAIRSPVLTGGAGAGSFLYLEDGVPLRAAGFSNVNGLFESGLEIAGGAEVVKGPGSVLYGSNAVHGLINVLSRRPEAQNQGSINIMVGSDDYVSVKSSVTGPIGTGATRASVSVVHDGGFREASGYDQQKFQLRYDGRVSVWDTKTLLSFTNLNQETAGFVQGPDAYLDEDLSSQNANPEAYRDARAARAQINFSKTTDADSVVNITPYLRWNDMEFLRHFVPGQAREENGHKSLGLLLNYYRPNATGDLTLGFDAEVTDGFLVEFQDGPRVFSLTQGEHYDYTVQSVVLSGYGQYELDISAKTRLSLGARADYTGYKYNNHIDTGVFGRFQRIDDQSDDFFIVTPKASLTHTLDDDATVYLRAARGSRAPQTSDLYSLQINQRPSEIESETLDTLETGYRIIVGSFKLEAAAYYMEKDNFFFRNAAGFNVTGGTTDHLGAEFSFDGTIFPGLSLAGDMSWARHRYTFDEPSSGIVSGTDVDTAPRQIANLRLEYSSPSAFKIGLEWRHMGDYFTDPGNTQTYSGHDVFVLRGSKTLTENLAIYARIDNLFDTRYANRADFAFGNERYFPGRPRTLFVGAHHDF
jgi:outer membrane receptor protein involved in Fe transport